MVVALPTLDPPTPGVPRPLFNANLGSTPGSGSAYAVAPDGKRFLLVRSASLKSEPMSVILGWQDRLKERR